MAIKLHFCPKLIFDEVNVAITKFYKTRYQDYKIYFAGEHNSDDILRALLRLPIYDFIMDICLQDKYVLGDDPFPFAGFLGSAKDDMWGIHQGPIQSLVTEIAHYIVLGWKAKK